MQRFKSSAQAQQFLSAHGMIYGHFRPRRAADLTAVQAAAADRTGARSQTEALAQMHSGIAWAPAR